MNHLEELKNNEEIFLNFMKEKYPFVSKSNFFFRDLQYGITYFFKNKNENIRITLAESITKDFADHLVKENKISEVSKNTWRLNHSFVNEITEAELEEK